MTFRASLFFLLSVSVGLSLTPSLAQTQKPDVTASFSCPVTVPNGSEPPSEPPKFVNREGDTLLLPTMHGAQSHGNGKLWTTLPPRVLRGGVFRQGDGVLGRTVRIDWLEMGRGLLTIKGKRLDGPAPPLHIESWGSSGPTRGADGIRYVMATVIFPTQGCWEITGKIYDSDDSALTFVVEVKVPN